MGKGGADVGGRMWVPACAGMTERGVGMTERGVGMTERGAGMMARGAGMMAGGVAWAIGVGREWRWWLAASHPPPNLPPSRGEG